MKHYPSAPMTMRLFLTLALGLTIVEILSPFLFFRNGHEYLAEFSSFVRDNKTRDRLLLIAGVMRNVGGNLGTAEKSWKKIDAAQDWKPFITSEHPYNVMTPKLNVVWNRGYYNVALPHKERPISYHNARGYSSKALSPIDFKTYFTSHQCGIMWIRLHDIKQWVNTILPKSGCASGNITIITSDDAMDIPNALPREVPEKIYQLDKIKAWYSTNVVSQNQPKLFPVPLGLPIQYGFPGSPDSEFTIKTMNKLRLAAKPFAERKRAILYDVGTLGGSSRRDHGRKATKKALEKCAPGKIEIMPKGRPLESWSLYASHRFAIVSIGVGFDTFRFWEFLFYGTVPIILSSPLDPMYLDAHVPCIIVKDWSEVCSWTEEDVEKLSNRFQGWIANSHMWLSPSLWVPRDQARMDNLCNASPGCWPGGHFFNATKLD